MKTFILLVLAITLGISLNDRIPRLYRTAPALVTTVAQITPTPTPNVDKLVDTYSKKYGVDTYKQNRTKAMIHFLLLKEQNYGGSDACGDGGKACGPLQFHEPTYIGYRKIMIRRGLVSEIGSRLDMKDAIETTAWAINNGRETAWGPILRGEINL